MLGVVDDAHIQFIRIEVQSTRRKDNAPLRKAVVQHHAHASTLQLRHVGGGAALMAKIDSFSIFQHQPCHALWLPKLLASGFHHPQQAVTVGERGGYVDRKIEGAWILINILHGLLQNKGRKQQPGVVGAEVRQKGLG